MRNANYPSSRSCQIPADCYNLTRLARHRADDYRLFPLPGLGDNVMYLGERNWCLWNRKLNTLLMSWGNFRNAERTGLSQPVECTLTIHHSYSRTLIHRINYCVQTYMARELQRHQARGDATIIQWPGKKGEENRQRP